MLCFHCYLDTKTLLEEQASLIIEKDFGVGTSAAENSFIKKDIESVSLSLAQSTTKQYKKEI